MLGLSALHREWAIVPDSVRYGAAGLAALLAAIGVTNALRVPPLKDVEIGISDLPSQFEGYRIIQPALTSVNEGIDHLLGNRQLSRRPDPSRS